MAQADQNAEESSKRKAKPSTRMSPPSLVETSSSKQKGSHSCAIGPTITRVADDTDDANENFLSMLLSLHIIRRWSM
jgi:hypothetical protein